MRQTTAAKRRKKPANRYHHGDLRQALIDEALRTIQQDGVEQLTLRTVGDRLGVSRTALYRHFSGKPALLAAVGSEGFRMLHRALADAREGHGRGRPGFEAMGIAYIRFAVAHPSHYRVMFGRFAESCETDAGFLDMAGAAFNELVDSIVEQQRDGIVRGDEPVLLSRFIWSAVHGAAMLAIDGQLHGVDDDGEILAHYSVQRLRDAVAAAA